MIDAVPDKPQFPAISNRDVEDIITQCSDLTLQLSYTQTVTAIFCASINEGTRFEHWIGKSLASIVAADSVGKLTSVLSDNAASSTCEGNWRHLNFQLLDGVTIPLLLKYFEFSGVRQRSRLICARDLSGQLQIQKLLQEELMRLERDRQALFPARKG